MSSVPSVLRVIVAAAVVALAGCGWIGANRVTAEKVVSKSFPTKAPPKVIVETFNGRVDVTATSPGEVHAEVTKRAGASTQEAAEADLDNIDVTLAQDGDTVVIRARVTDQKLVGHRSADVTVQVPEQSMLDLRTTNGKLSAIGLLGDVIAESSNGAVNVKGSRGKLVLATANGAVKVEGGATVEARTSNGVVRVKDARGPVTARTSNGTVLLSGKLAAGDYDLETINGKVMVTLPANAQFRLDARTTLGVVSCGFNLSETDEKARKRLRGTVGKDPKATLKLRTGNGRIEIRPESGAPAEED